MSTTRSKLSVFVWKKQVDSYYYGFSGCAALLCEQLLKLFTLLLWIKNSFKWTVSIALVATFLLMFIVLRQRLLYIIYFLLQKIYITKDHLIPVQTNCVIRMIRLTDTYNSSIGFQVARLF